MRDKLELIARTLEAQLSHAAVAPVPSAAGPRCGERSLAGAGALGTRAGPATDDSGHSAQQRSCDLGRVGPRAHERIPGRSQPFGFGQRLFGQQRECRQTAFRSCPRGEFGSAGHPDGMRLGTGAPATRSSTATTKHEGTHRPQARGPGDGAPAAVRDPPYSEGRSSVPRPREPAGEAQRNPPAPHAEQYAHLDEARSAA